MTYESQRIAYSYFLAAILLFGLQMHSLFALLIE